MVEFVLGENPKVSVGLLIKNINRLSKKLDKKHRFEQGRRDFRVVFSDIKNEELVSFVGVFGGLFSGVLVG